MMEVKRRMSLRSVIINVYTEYMKTELSIFFFYSQDGKKLLNDYFTMMFENYSTAQVCRLGRKVN